MTTASRRAPPSGERGRHAPPGAIAALIGWPGLGWLARVALASPFLVSGAWKSVDLPGTVVEVQGLLPLAPALVAWLVIAVQLGGSALFLSRRWYWLGAGLLAGFTALATLLAHPFWAFAGSERAHEASTFFEHVAIVGGFAAAAILVHARSRS